MILLGLSLLLNFQCYEIKSAEAQKTLSASARLFESSSVLGKVTTLDPRRLTVNEKGALSYCDGKFVFTSFSPSYEAHGSAKEPITAATFNTDRLTPLIAVGNEKGEVTIFSTRIISSLMKNLAKKATNTIGAVGETFAIDRVTQWAKHEKLKREDYEVFPLVTLDNPAEQLKVMHSPINDLIFFDKGTCLAIATRALNTYSTSEGTVPGYDASKYNETVTYVTNTADANPHAYIPMKTFAKQTAFPCRCNSHADLCCVNQNCIVPCKNMSNQSVLHMLNETLTECKNILISEDGNIEKIASSGDKILVFIKSQFYLCDTEKDEIIAYKNKVSLLDEKRKLSLSVCGTMAAYGKTIFKFSPEGRADVLIEDEKSTDYFFTDTGLIQTIWTQQNPTNCTVVTKLNFKSPEEVAAQLELQKQEMSKPTSAVTSGVADSIQEEKESEESGKEEDDLESKKAL